MKATWIWFGCVGFGDVWNGSVDAGQMQEFGFWLYKLQGFGLALLVRQFGLAVQAARFG
jgi:hypothetical protein